MAKTDLTAERLRELLDYNPDTGVFTWAKCSGRHGRYAKGSIAGCINQKGYRVIAIGYNRYMAHQLAWLFFHGVWSLKQIDHIDGNKSNNSILNLREATQKENSQNQKFPHSNNKSGFLGVSKKSEDRYQALIAINGKTKSLGYYDTAELASIAYMEAKKRIHPFGCVAGDFKAPEKRTFLSRSKSGYVGVNWDNESGKWIAKPFIGGKQVTLGRFASAEEAYKKILNEKNRVH